MRLKPIEAVEQYSGEEKEPKPKQQPAIICSATGLVQYRAAEGTEMEDAWLLQLLLIIHPELWDDAALAVRAFDSFLNGHNVPQSNLGDDAAILLLLSSPAGLLDNLIEHPMREAARQTAG
jgi:hypothetical protein